MTSYQLTIEERPAYMYAKATGERTPPNALRLLEEAYAACVKSGRDALLLEMAFYGPDLMNTTSVYHVISQRVSDGRTLRKIAYVDSSTGDPAMPYYAEAVAINRGVNVRLFQSVDAAGDWLSEDC